MSAQKIVVQIEIDLSTAAFDVRVYNASVRKGYVDIEGLRDRLRDVMHFMTCEGIDEVLGELQAKQSH